MEGLLSPAIKYDHDEAYVWFEENMIPLIDFLLDNHIDNQPFRHWKRLVFFHILLYF